MFTYILTKYSDKLKQDDFVLDWSFLKADPLEKISGSQSCKQCLTNQKLDFVGEALSQAL